MTTLGTRTLSRLIVALAAGGAAVSAYLTWVHLADRPVVCAGLGSCATVQTSEYAEIGGVPVALLGLGLYVVIGLLALVGPHRPGAWLPLFVLALSGVLYSGYLTWVEVAVLGAVCLWCAASAAILVAIAALAAWVVLAPAAAPAPAAWERRRRLGRR